MRTPPAHCRLRNVAGGDDARIDAMTSSMGIQLVGRRPLPPRVIEFLRAVLTARGQPLPPPQQSAQQHSGAAQGALSSPAQAAAAQHAPPVQQHPAWLSPGTAQALQMAVASVPSSPRAMAQPAQVATCTRAMPADTWRTRRLSAQAVAPAAPPPAQAQQQAPAQQNAVEDAAAQPAMAWRPPSRILGAHGAGGAQQASPAVQHSAAPSTAAPATVTAQSSSAAANGHLSFGWITLDSELDNGRLEPSGGYCSESRQ